MSDLTMGNCLRCGACLKLRDELELSPVSGRKGSICARCLEEMSAEEFQHYL